MDLKTRNLFFNAYILLHFDYCNTHWGHSSSEIQTRMLMLQKKAPRYILDVDYSHPSRGLFMIKTLNWLPFLNIVQINTAILILNRNDNDNNLKSATQSNNTLIFPVALSVQHHYGTPARWSQGYKNSFTYCSFKYFALKE